MTAYVPDSPDPVFDKRAELVRGLRELADLIGRVSDPALIDAYAYVLRNLATPAPSESGVFAPSTKTPPPVGGPSHPDGQAIPDLGGESVEDGGVWSGMSEDAKDVIADLFVHDAKLRGYEDPAAVAE